jgi:hypothetical protein
MSWQSGNRSRRQNEKAQILHRRNQEMAHGPI